MMRNMRIWLSVFGRRGENETERMRPGVNTPQLLRRLRAEPPVKCDCLQEDLLWMLKLFIISWQEQVSCEQSARVSEGGKVSPGPLMSGQFSCRHLRDKRFCADEARLPRSSFCSFLPNNGLCLLIFFYLNKQIKQFSGALLRLRGLKTLFREKHLTSRGK